MQAFADVCAGAGIASRVHVVEGANHNFYSVAWAREVVDQTRVWLRREPAPEGRAEAPARRDG